MKLNCVIITSTLHKFRGSLLYAARSIAILWYGHLKGCIRENTNFTESLIRKLTKFYVEYMLPEVLMHNSLDASRLPSSDSNSYQWWRSEVLLVSKKWAWEDDLLRQLWMKDLVVSLQMCWHKTCWHKTCPLRENCSALTVPQDSYLNCLVYQPFNLHVTMHAFISLFYFVIKIIRHSAQILLVLAYMVTN